jgi:hypothetical protein
VLPKEFEIYQLQTNLIQVQIFYLFDFNLNKFINSYVIQIYLFFGSLSRASS